MAEINYVSFDTETTLIGPGEMPPRLICGALREKDGEGCFVFDHVGDDLETTLIELLTDESCHVVLHNGQFDWLVSCRRYPNLLPYVLDALEEGRIHDTQIREKLLNLATSGKVDMMEMPDGSGRKIEYSLAALASKYLGIDLTSDKEDDDSWRLNFSMLENKRVEEYPQEALNYVGADVKYTLDIFEAQEQRAQTEFGGNHDPFLTEGFQVAVSFALGLMGVAGIAIDEVERTRLSAMLEFELSPEKTKLLVMSGILRPGEPPRPKKRGIGMTAGKKPSVNQVRLREIIQQLCESENIPIKETEKGQIATDGDFIDMLSKKSDVLKEFAHRQSLMKLVSTELPRIQAAFVQPQYDVLKETGRTSSSASKLFPSTNIQNVDPRARGCYVPRPGWVFASVDYSAIELVSLAQKCFTLFGVSRLRDLINGGIDPHGFLGAQLAYYFDANFYNCCVAEGVTSPEAIHKAFESLKTQGDEAKAYFKHWRTFAKPVGLGFPGGLGPDTFVDFAHGTYQVDVTRAEAEKMREVWFMTYPEMRSYFDWISNCCMDPRNGDKYAYVSPFGMLRSGATWSACANGAALQTPTAEGAKLAVWNVVRSCYDPTKNSCLYGARPLMFIHDEIITEIPEDEWMHERAHEIARIMVDSMKTVMSDVAVKAEPALMRRWDKRAEPVYRDGRLQVWTPSEKNPK